LSQSTIGQELAFCVLNSPNDPDITVTTSKIKAILTFNPSPDGIKFAISAATELKKRKKLRETAKIVQTLIAGLPTNMIDATFLTAIENKQHEWLNMFLSSGNTNGPTQKLIDDALSTATQNGDKDIVSSLLKHRIGPSQDAIDSAFLTLSKTKNKWTLKKAFVAVENRLMPSISAIQSAFRRAKPDTPFYRHMYLILDKASALPDDPLPSVSDSVAHVDVDANGKLPVDVLCEIAKWLTLTDFMNLISTCRFFSQLRFDTRTIQSVFLNTFGVEAPTEAAVIGMSKRCVDDMLTVLDDRRMLVLKRFVKPLFEMRDKSWIPFLSERMENAEKETLLLKSAQETDFETFSVIANNMAVPTNSRIKVAEWIKARFV
jgi:hypothetical protein